MKFMFQYPDASGVAADMLAAGPVAELARAAEGSGWSGMAFTEHPAPSRSWLAAGGHQTLDPFVALAHAAAVTSRLALLTYLSVLPYRNPLLLAKAAASVDLLSGGRFVLGAGTGYAKAEFHALGVDFEERNALFDEALDVLPLHWSGEPFGYHGRHFSARDVQALPRPAQQPIPIWIGGNSQLARRRVAQRAQGWMPMLGPDELFATTLTPRLGSGTELATAIAQLREAAGPRGGDIDVAVPYRDRSLHDPNFDPAAHRAALDELTAAGVTWVILPGPSGDRDDSLAYLDRVGWQLITG